MLASDNVLLKLMYTTWYVAARIQEKYSEPWQSALSELYVNYKVSYINYLWVCLCSIFILLKMFYVKIGKYFT